MDVFNQPPSIAEDTLRFRIHSATPSLASVTALRTLIVNFVENELLPPTHIWHRDSLQFNVVSELGASPDASSTVIEGNIRVGDAVDDEWLVVWLLFEISRKWDVIISVSDSDGEFLLIEAAESLPKWVTPENVENRVWIYQSRLHLIPLDRSSTGYDKSKRRRRQSNYSGDEGDFSRTTGDDDQWISVPDALKVVRDPSVPTTTSEGVQSIIQRKISRYPAATQKHIHITNAYIPSDIALALSQNRGLIQKSVEAFYTRDALQLRAASKMARFPPDTSILASVAMTRTAYAQLSGQRFHAPKVFGREWSPPAEGTAEWRWRDIGMKIACGFEMLYAETRSKSSQVDASQGVMPRHAARSPAYDQYMSDLKRGGWFGEEIEGSEKWKERQRQADESWNETLKDKEKEEDGHASSRNQRTPFSRLVEEAVAASAPKKDAILFQNAQPPVEDSDDWLNVSSADIETMLAGSLPVSGKTKAQGVLTDEDDETKHTTEKLANLAQKVDKFVMDPEEKGDLDGAIFDDDDDAADEDSIFSNSEDEGKDKALSDDLDSSASDSEKEEVAAEARRRAAMDALVAPLGPDEYGKLPAVPAPLTDADMDIGGEAKTRSKAKLEPVQMRKPILVRDKFDGVDSDDETSSEDEDATGDDAVKRRELLEAMREEEGVVDADDEAFPQVVDGGVDMEVDMAAEEEAFLKFAREELGVNEDMWNGILDERKGRGAFIPASAGNTKTNAVADSKVPAIDTTWFKPSKGGGRQKRARFMDAISRSDDAQPASALTPASTKASKEEPLIQPRARNPNLDSFEAVMEAMDVELQKARESRKQGKEKDTSGAKPQNPAKVDKGGKGKGKQTHISSSEDEDEDDMDSAMDAELRASLRRGASGEGSRSDSDGEVEDATMDYNLIKNFLESFKSQAGTAGPVSSLARRLEKGWTLPRDESG
ncbi:hypothetical protein FRB94_007765 [Tulasnella sp. JGI-2019a]|nr:hypothetical protein FRB93_007157 [Tulasnella sp. JGI-2019a]KAG8997316.1 hypothetical protein FRB94_007765 [Tulasnella sp. JGI-2019a]